MGYEFIENKYFRSEDIKVFPCAYRGQDEINNIVFDPEANGFTEYNYSNLYSKPSTKKESFLIDWNSELLRVVIGGYYFEIKNVAPADIANKYLAIKLVNVDLGNGTTNQTALLDSFTENTLCLDINFASSVNSALYAFTGLAVLTEEEANKFPDKIQLVKSRVEEEEVEGETIEVTYYDILPATRRLEDVLTTGDGVSSICTKGSLNNTDSEANGLGSIALGINNLADKDNTIALGNNNKAKGENSIAIGLANKVEHDNSIALGNNLISSTEDQLIIGKFNDSNETAAIILGQGTEDTARANILTVSKEGDIVTAGAITATGAITTADTITAVGSLTVSGSSDGNNLYLGSTAENDAGSITVYGAAAATVDFAGEKYTQAEIDAAHEGDPAYGKTTNDWKTAPTINNNESKVFIVDNAGNIETIGNLTVKGKISLKNGKVVINDAENGTLPIELKDNTKITGTLLTTGSTTIGTNVIIATKGSTNSISLNGNTSNTGTFSSTDDVKIGSITKESTTYSGTGHLITKDGATVQTGSISIKDSNSANIFNVDAANGNITTTGAITAAGNCTIGGSIAGESLITTNGISGNRLIVTAPDNYGTTENPDYRALVIQKITNETATEIFSVNKAGNINTTGGIIAKTAKIDNIEISQSDITTGDLDDIRTITNKEAIVFGHGGHFNGDLTITTNSDLYNAGNGGEHGGHFVMFYTDANNATTLTTKIANNGTAYFNQKLIVGGNTDGINVNLSNDSNNLILDSLKDTYKVYLWTDKNRTAITGKLLVKEDIYSEGNLFAKDLALTGDINTSGNIIAKSYNALSDARKKTEIKDFKYRESILNLPIKEFEYKDDEKHVKHIGCIAQDLQLLYPELVHEDKDGYLSIEENKLVYLLLEEVKVLKKEIKQLRGE